MFTLKNAVRVTSSTLVGVLPGEFPLAGGNCFSVECDDGSGAAIVNFGLENLEELLQHRGLTWPVQIALISERIGVIHDPRIHDSWYRSQFCETCCPRELLPLPQLLQQFRAEARGEQVRSENSVMYDSSKGEGLCGAPPKPQPLAYTVHIEQGPVIGHIAALDKVDFQ